MLSSHLLEAVSQTVQTLPPDSISNVVSAFEETADGTPFPHLRARVLTSVALPGERAVLDALLQACEREWELTGNRGGLRPAATLLAAALQSALHTKAAIERLGRVELAWTGPASGVTFRRTDQALLQVIQEARRELLLVTFAAYHVPLLLDAIRQALKRGVEVRFLGESAHESGGKVSFDAAHAFGAIAHQMHFYVWPNEKRATDSTGKSGSLHAKLALADGELLFLSSANFTEHALLLNMEMGILVRGGDIPTQARDHFRILAERGQIVNA